MPSLSRRRVVTAAGILVASLLVLSFARQVGEATAATNRAAELRAANAALREEVSHLEQDLDHVQDQRFIRQEGRAYGLGGKGEIPFALAAGAPELAADAPGSASVRLGVEPRPQSPLDAWLEVLFGPGR
jgi:cell division protein FtsB